MRIPGIAGIAKRVLRIYTLTSTRLNRRLVRNIVVSVMLLANWWLAPVDLVVVCAAAKYVRRSTKKRNLKRADIASYCGRAEEPAIPDLHFGARYVPQPMSASSVAVGSVSQIRFLLTVVSAPQQCMRLWNTLNVT